MKKKIIVLGSANVDLVLYSDKFPEKGETVFGNEFFINQGGKGANQAAAASKIGADVTFIGRVGDDFFGRFINESMKSFGVKTHFFVDKTAATGVALINVDRLGENCITIIKGANGLVGKEEVDYVRQITMQGDIFLLQGEIPTEAIIEASKLARDNSGTVIFDPAPVRGDLRKIIPLATYITPNEVELEKLTKTNNPLELIEAGAENIVLKLGSRGIRFINSKTDISLPAFVVDTVDTTGAGDTFNGSFAAALALDYDLESALKFAIAASAVSVTRKGAAVSSPTFKEVVKFLEEKDEQDNY